MDQHLELVDEVPELLSPTSELTFDWVNKAFLENLRVFEVLSVFQEILGMLCWLSC